MCSLRSGWSTYTIISLAVLTEDVVIILLTFYLQTTSSSWEMPAKWPLWFRAAADGNVSLCITIYYEMEDGSSVITYRTLRMHYNVEVNRRHCYMYFELLTQIIFW